MLNPLQRLTTRIRQAREPEPESLIPFQRHVTHEIVEGFGGGFCAAYRVEGVSKELDNDDEIVGGWLDLNEKLTALSDPRRGYVVHLVKSEADPSDFPESGHGTGFAHRFNEAYKQTLYEDPDNRLFRFDCYLTLTVAPMEDSERSARDRLGFKGKKRTSLETEAARATALEDYCSQAEAQLAPYRLTRLRLRPVPPEGIDPSIFPAAGWRDEFAEAMHHVLYNQRAEINLHNGPLHSAIYANRITIGAQTVELHLPGGPRFAAVLSPRKPALTTWPTRYRPVLRAPISYCLTHGFNFWPDETGRGRMRLRRHQMINARDPAASQARLLSVFADRLTNGKFAAGDAHMSLTVFADDAGGISPTDPARLRYINKAAADGAAALAGARVNATREDLGLIAAFFAQLPTNNHLRTRPGLDTTENLAGDAPFDIPPRGNVRGHWGDPVLMLRTQVGTGFRFHIHAPEAIDESGDVGNTLVIGPTGSGKTILLAAIMTQAERLGARVVLFDKDRGAEIYVRASGGTYLSLRNGAPTGFAPLKALEHTPRNLDYWAGSSYSPLLTEGLKRKGFSRG